MQREADGNRSDGMVSWMSEMDYDCFSLLFLDGYAILHFADRATVIDVAA
jgi:hypothetical protein